MSVPITSRVVAIIGRPNVGKSSLFNRLIGRRIAIVHSESGVTRDSLMHEVAWRGVRFNLLDTGGLVELEDSQGHDAVIAAAVRDQVETVAQDATAIILVTDVRSGLVPADEEIAARLRPLGRPIFLAANKSDTPDLEQTATEFERLGFPLFPVSAMHGRGLETLMRAVVRALPAAAKSEKETPLRVTVAGRPNVGKSSFLNRLLHSNRLIVTPVPGTTRDSIDIPFTMERNQQKRHYLLTDTAGIRRGGRLEGAVEFFSITRARRSIADADVVALMIDAQEGPTLQDRRLANIILEQGRACVLLVNKWDAVKETSIKEYHEALRRALPFLHFVPIVFISARTGFNVNKTLDSIDAVAANIRVRLPTGILNRVLSHAYENTPPPIVKGRRLKIYYAVQTGNQPVSVTLFANNPAKLAPAFSTYLERTLRGAFPLEGVPVRILAKAAHERTALKTVDERKTPEAVELHKPQNKRRRRKT